MVAGRAGWPLDIGEEPFLTMVEQITNRGDIIGGEVDLSGDLDIGVTDRRSPPPSLA
jgi:hypothetical protein